MANEYAVRRVWNPTTGDDYREGTDYTDDGDGTITVIPGSTLDDDGGTGKLDRTVFDSAAPAGDLHFTVDSTYSGLKKVSSPSQAYSAGTAINAHMESIHPIDAIEGNQGSVSFNAYCADSGAQSLAVDDYICLRLGNEDLTGTSLGQSEDYYKITQRDPEQDSNGLRYYRYIALDLGEDVRAADVSGIPRQAEADTVTYPGDTGGPPQAGIVGQRAYTLSMLLSAVAPAYATVVLNAPDMLIEQLPQEGDGLELLSAALKATAYYMRWEGVQLVIEQHEPAAHNISLALTDTQVVEVKTEMAPAARAVDSVRIDRPQPGKRFRDTGLKGPALDGSPNGGGGSAYMPAEGTTYAGLDGETTLYEVNLEWTPTQEFLNYEPQDLMFGFSDTAYLRTASGGQLYALLRNTPQNCTIQPPQRWTKDQPINGPTGTDWYFLVKPDFIKISQSNLDYVDGFVVSRNGYYADTGAISRNQSSIPGAVVLLIGTTTGVRLDPTTTNNEGYFRVATGGIRDRWRAEVYDPTDSYQANLNSTFTDGHPWDDDPNNDNLGPNNTAPREDSYQLLTTKVQFSVVYDTGREVPEDGPANVTGDMPELYRGAGSFLTGDEALLSTMLIDESSLDIDPANITSEVQATLLGEKIIDRSEEERNVVVITKPFGGTLTQPGKCIAVRITADGGVTADVRVITRERQVTPTGIWEVLSTSADTFVNEQDRRFAKKRPVETKLRTLGNRMERAFQQLLAQLGELEDTAGSGVR